MIAVIGASGKLGHALMRLPNTIECPIKFEEADKFADWFKENNKVDTIWYVARACREKDPRRDFNTFMLEQYAMQRLLMTRAKNCRFVYASTKVVYGITSEEVTPLSANTIAEAFIDDTNGIVNCPAWKKHDAITIKGLGHDHIVYAMTKLACEQFIQSYCTNYKIIRIWDIL